MITFFRSLIAQDFWLKLFSLALAILIWLTVQFSISKEISPWAALIGHGSAKKSFTVPVLVILPAADVRNVTVTPAEVQVEVQGQTKMLNDLRTEEIKAQVNLMGIESARGLRKRIEIILPPGVTYTHIIPEEVEVRVRPGN